MQSEVLKEFSILAVEDLASIRFLIKRLLASEGCRKVYAVEDIDTAQRYLDEVPVDCILLDYELETANGLDLVRALRAEATHPKRDVPILLLTSHASPEIVQAAVHAGCDGYLVKPVHPRRLANRICTVIADRTGARRETWEHRSSEVRWF